MTAVVLFIVHLVAWLWVVWSIGTLLRLRRKNADLAATNARMATAVIEATAALNMCAERSNGLVRRHQRARETALDGLPARIFGDAEGRN